jgi:hypothetical protein
MPKQGVTCRYPALNCDTAASCTASIWRGRSGFAEAIEIDYGRAPLAADRKKVVGKG